MIDSRLKGIRQLVLVLYLLLAVFLPADLEAQQASKNYRIGYLAPGTIHESFRDGLRELGYIEKKNLLFEYRQAKATEQYPGLAVELVGRRVDLILTVDADCRSRGQEPPSRDVREAGVRGGWRSDELWCEH